LRIHLTVLDLNLNSTDCGNSRAFIFGWSKSVPLSRCCSVSCGMRASRYRLLSEMLHRRDIASLTYVGPSHRWNTDLKARGIRMIALELGVRALRLLAVDKVLHFEHRGSEINFRLAQKLNEQLEMCAMR